MTKKTSTPSEPAAEGRNAGVVEHDGQDRERAKPVNISPVSEMAWNRLAHELPGRRKITQYMRFNLGLRRPRGGSAREAVIAVTLTPG